MPSKKPIFPLRLDPELRERAEAAAATSGATLNGWISQLIATAIDSGTLPRSATPTPPKKRAAKVKQPPNRARRRYLAKIKRQAAAMERWEANKPGPKGA